MTTPRPEDLPIERVEGESNGRYSVRIDGAEAEMTYSRPSETVIAIDHTEVPDAMRGRSVGQAMVQRAVEHARAEGRSIIPICSFVNAQFSRHPEWQDLLAEPEKRS